MRPRLIRRLPPLLVALLVCWLLDCLPAEAWLCVPLFFLPGCACCGGGIAPFTCDECTSDVPNQLDLEITGLANGTNCSTCSSYDGLYTINVFSGVCGWNLLFPRVNMAEIGFILYKNGTDYTGDATITFNDGVNPQSRVEYKKVYGATRADCMNFAAENIPYSNTTVPTFCDGSASTATLTTV